MGKLGNLKKYTKNPLMWIGLLALVLIILSVTLVINPVKVKDVEEKTLKIEQIKPNDNSLKMDKYGDVSFKYKVTKGTQLKIYDGYESESFGPYKEKDGYITKTVEIGNDNIPNYNLKLVFSKDGYKNKTLKFTQVNNLRSAAYSASLESAAANSSVDLDYDIQNLITDNTDYSDVDVSGAYESDPYTGVITITSNDDVRTVVANVLGTLQKKAGDTLNKFDSIDISVKDKNGNYALKSNYNISTIMSNQQVYRPFKVKDLANTWTEN